MKRRGIKMLAMGRLWAVCMVVAGHNVSAGGFGSGHHSFQRSSNARASHEADDSEYNEFPSSGYQQDAGVAYDTSVTTEMNYVDHSKGKSTKRNYHAEYEYIAGDSQAGDYEYGKGGKKGRYHGYEFTHSPTSVEHGHLYGKGQGKGYSADVGKGSKTAKKSSEDGKGKGGKGGKKGSKKAYYPTHTPHTSPPTHAPVSAPSGDYGVTRPPTPISEPTRSPSSQTNPTQRPASSPPDRFTASPTDSGSIAINLEPFSLLYETETSRQATRSELAEVTDTTRLYLEDFMFDEFSQSSFTFLDDFITRMITSTYVTNAPYVVDYSSTARFNTFSTVFPENEQLDEALVIAFTGSNLEEYIGRLEDLSVNNVFRGANVFFGEPVVRVSKKTSNNAATIAAATIAATLLAAGAVIYKRRSTSEFIEGKELNKDKGDATIAGETFTGETYDGTASMDAASLDHLSRYRDEEGDDEGVKAQTLLGTIEEGDDDNSVRLAWGTSVSYAGSFDTDTQEVDFEDEPSSPHGNEASNQAYDVHRIRRAATEGSSLISPSIASDLVTSTAHSFDEMALQGMAQLGSNRMPDLDESSSSSPTSHKTDSDMKAFDRKDEPTVAATPEIASLLSHDSFDEYSVARTVTSSTGSMSSNRRPRTVAEIEAMLSADNDAAEDEETRIYKSRKSSSDNDSLSRATPSQGPRTVEEIESLLSVDLGNDGDDDDDEEGNGYDLD